MQYGKTSTIVVARFVVETPRRDVSTKLYEMVSLRTWSETHRVYAYENGIVLFYDNFRYWCRVVS